MGYILRIERYMPYNAIGVYSKGLGYHVARKSLQKLVEKTLEKKALPSLPGLPGGGHGGGLALPQIGKLAQFLQRETGILTSTTNMTAASGSFATLEIREEGERGRRKAFLKFLLNILPI